VEGTFLNRHRLARSPERIWQRVEEWLLALTNPAATVDERWHAEQISDPLHRIAQALPATAEEQRLFAATESLTQDLASIDLPAPIEHGDLFKAHVVASRGGRLTAIDWELGRREGLVGANAATFLLDVFRGPASGLAGEDTARAYARHFLDESGLARQWLQAHLRHQGVDPRWVEHILLATWARRALQVWEPVVSETAERQQREHARTLFRNFWSLQLWRTTLEQMTG
jgi:hypothetical protein